MKQRIFKTGGRKTFRDVERENERDRDREKYTEKQRDMKK